MNKYDTFVFRFTNHSLYKVEGYVAEAPRAGPSFNTIPIYFIFQRYNSKIIFFFPYHLP